MPRSARPAAPAIQAEAAPAPALSALAGRTALVLENDLPILEGMIGLLERWKMRAIPVVSVQEALESLETLTKLPDILIADYHLDNGENGLDAILALRTTGGRAIPAMLITADHSQQLKTRATDSDVEILHKPVHSQDLSAAIGRLIGP